MLIQENEISVNVKLDNVIFSLSEVCNKNTETVKIHKSMEQPQQRVLQNSTKKKKVDCWNYKRRNSYIQRLNQDFSLELKRWHYELLNKSNLINVK